MTVPAREVQVGWRVNPDTPHEWVVGSSEPYYNHRLWYLGEGPNGLIYMRVPPDQLVDAAPPPRTITVPAMDDAALFGARRYVAALGSLVTPFELWVSDALAAHEREAT